MLNLSTGQSGRVYGKDLTKWPLEVLANELERLFYDEDDLSRTDIIHKYLESHNRVEFTPYFDSNGLDVHAYLNTPEGLIFACFVVTDPSRFIDEVTFEVYSLQVFNGNMVRTLEAWVKRVWPNLKVPRIELA